MSQINDPIYLQDDGATLTPINTRALRLQVDADEAFIIANAADTIDHFVLNTNSPELTINDTDFTVKNNVGTTIQGTLTEILHGSSGDPVTANNESSLQVEKHASGNGWTTQSAFTSQGLAASGYGGPLSATLITNAGDDATSTLLGAYIDLNDTASTPGTMWGILFQTTAGTWDQHIVSYDEDLKLFPFSSTGQGYSIQLKASDAVSGDTNGGSIVATLGQGNGTGDGGTFDITGDTGDEIRLNLKNTRTLAADDTVAQIDMEDGIGNTWATIFTEIVGQAPSDKYARLGIEMMVENDKTPVLFISAEDDGGTELVDYELAGEGRDQVFLYPGQEEDDTNAGAVFVIEGQEGGSDDAGTGGNDGGNTYIQGGIGSDADAGDNDGGDGGDVYVGAGSGGSESGTGAAGATGTVYLGKNFDDDTSISEFEAGVRYPVTTVNAATYDTDSEDYILNVTYTGTAAVTSLTLSTSDVVAGRTLVIKDAGGNASSNNITIDTEGAETIDGQATYVINSNYGAINLYCDGSNWFVF